MKRKINKLIKAIFVLIAILVLIIVLGITGYIETHYSTTGTIIEIINDAIVVETEDNNVWVFYGDGFNTGDLVTIEMFTNGTDLNRYDDEIVKIKRVF